MHKIKIIFKEKCAYFQVPILYNAIYLTSKSSYTKHWSLKYSLRYMNKRVWVTVIWCNETVTFRFAKVLHFSSYLWISESQSRPIWITQLNVYIGLSLIAKISLNTHFDLKQRQTVDNNTVKTTEPKTRRLNRFPIEQTRPLYFLKMAVIIFVPNYCNTTRTYVESVLVRLVTIGLGASKPILVGDKCCAIFDASCSPLPCDSLMLIGSTAEEIKKKKNWTPNSKTSIIDFFTCDVRIKKSKTILRTSAKTIRSREAKIGKTHFARYSFTMFPESDNSEVSDR